jgi:Carboxypeptidase regulatory-like domain/TonB dependent receptor
MKKHPAISLLWLCLLLLPAFGQEFRATVTGRVVDPSNAAIASATVIVRNPQTNEAVTVVTNSDGVYTVPFLNPGVYSISIEAPGFKKYIRDKQVLQVSQTATIDVTLELGATTETVTITADATTLLEETKADRGNVIENRRIVELPLNARNPFMLSTLTPGITYNGPAIYQRPFDNGAIADWSINGGLNRSNEFLLDGAPNNSIQGGNNIAYVPPVDAVGEFKIVTNSYDAQYGRTAGGVVNVQIKSGGNQFHGSLYEFYRRNWLDSNYLFSNARGIPAGRFRTASGELVKAEHYLDQYGGVIGGPIWLPKKVFGPAAYDGRDKSFFLFNYEGYREGTPNPQVITVPTDAFIQGDFREYKNSTGQVIPIYDPATNPRTQIQCDGVLNVICPERINPVAKNLLAFYPRPNTSTPGGEPWRNNYTDIPNIANDEFKNWLFKIDQVIGTNDRVFFRYGYNLRKEIRWTNAITSGPAQDGQLPLERINYAGVADWVHTFNGNLVLNVRASANRYIEAARSEPGLDFDATQLGFPASLSGQLPTRIFPRINLYSTGTTVETIQLGRGTFSNEPTNVFSFQPNLSLIKGSHSIRFGLDMRYTQYARQTSGNAGMVFSFDRTFTGADFNRPDALSGSSLAALLLGAPTGLNSARNQLSFVDFNVFPIYMYKYYAPWIQDDWKITRKLTLNLGLRYDLNLPAVERYNRLNFGFDPTAVNPVSARINSSNLLNGATQVFGGLGFAGGNNPNTPVRSDLNNIQPRIGIAYSLNEKTVLRAGFGRYFVNPVGDPGYPTNGFSVQTPFVASTNENRTSLFNLSNPFPNGIGQPAGASLGLETFLGRSFNYSNPDFRVPYVDNFSLGIQRQLPWNIAAEISYVGSRARDAQSRFGGVNEPSLAFRNQCDVTKGGDINICNQLLPNPFFGVPGFEGTDRFTSPTLSRYELSRPFPQFGAITEFERNEGRVWYNSLQVSVNKRMASGISVNSTYTFSKTIEEAIQQPGQQDNTVSYIDDVAGIKARGLAFADRPHRITVSSVWELPFGKGKRFLSNAGGLTNLFLGGWEAAGLYLFNSGRPWQLPGNVDVVDPNYADVEQKRFVGGAEWIQGVKPCVAQYMRDAQGALVPELLPYSVQYGCTAPSFIIREPFTTRLTPNRSDTVRRPSYKQFDINFSKRFRINERMAIQFRGEAYNLFNTPQFDERAFNQDPTNSDFGGINKNNIRQSNFPRFWQLGLKFLF